MSFGTTFADAAAEMEGEEGHEDSGDGLLTGVEPADDSVSSTQAFRHVSGMIDAGRAGVSMLLDTIASYRPWLTADQQETLKARVRWRAAHPRGLDPRIEAHAANAAHAAYRDASAGASYPHPRPMNVVITFADAARTFAYRGLNAIAGKLHEIAERIAPSR